MESKTRFVPVVVLIAAMAAFRGNSTAANDIGRTQDGFMSIVKDGAISISSYSSNLENFSKTAKFLTTLEINGGTKDGASWRRRRWVR